MKSKTTAFDFEMAFKTLNECEIPKTGHILPERDEYESMKKISKTDLLLEDYYELNDSKDVNDAIEQRAGEIAKAKLARIEKIVDLDAKTEEDLLPSYVGKFIIQCPQCLTLFYKSPEDIVPSEEDPLTVNVEEPCQHCGNTSGYSLIGKVAEADESTDTEADKTEDEDLASAEVTAESELFNNSEEDLSTLDGEASIDLEDSTESLTDTIEDEKSENSSEDSDNKNKKEESEEDESEEDESEEANEEEDKKESLDFDSEMTLFEGMDDLEDVDEESLNNLITESLKDIYSNIDSFKTSNINYTNNSFIVEGTIIFNNKVQKNTKFIFENFYLINKDTINLQGYSPNFKNTNSLMLEGFIKDACFKPTNILSKFIIKNTMVESIQKI